MMFDKVTKEVKQHQKTTEKIYPDRELEFRAKPVDHVYTWAELNSRSTDSKSNWKELYSGDLKFTIRDEGTLFKEITLTSDLLKQLINMHLLVQE